MRSDSIGGTQEQQPRDGAPSLKSELAIVLGSVLARLLLYRHKPLIEALAAWIAG